MTRKILLIDESKLVRDYIKEKLQEVGFDVILAKDGVDGLIKMRNQLPDLIIMDFYLSRLSCLEFLKEKQELKGTADIPVIILSSKIDRQSIIRIGKYKIHKLLSKPIEIDVLLNELGVFFKTKFEVDKSPCYIDVHLNDDILFIEIAQGLNKDKIELMKYKIIEIKEIYKIKFQKLLIIATNISFNDSPYEKLNILMEKIIETTEIPLTGINILTTSEKITNYFADHPKYNIIKITDDFTKAIDYFGKIDMFAYGEEIEDIKQEIISSAKNQNDHLEKSLNMKFSNENIKEIYSDPKDIDKNFVISVVDDDLSILEYMEAVLSQANWEINVYENGKIFINELKTEKPDLIFLDLLMPKMSGFEVLEYMLKNKINIPIIVLTALADKDSIIRARTYGATTYLTKPVDPDVIIHKAEEILKRNF